MNTHEIIVNAGEDIKEGIERFMLEMEWPSAYISGAIGSVRDLALTTPVGLELPPKVAVTPCVGPGEVLAFTGEVMKREFMDPSLKDIYKEDGPLFIHVHTSVATAGGHVFGGGMKYGKAFRALKIYIQQIA